MEIVASKAKGRCPLEPRQGTGPLDPSDGFARKGAQLCRNVGPGRAPFLAKPLDGFQGVTPWWGSRGQSPLTLPATIPIPPPRIGRRVP